MSITDKIIAWFAVVGIIACLIVRVRIYRQWRKALYESFRSET